MKLDTLSEVLWKYYSKGRPKATDQTIREADITQMVMMSYGALVRKRYIESRATDEFGEADISVISPALSVLEFPLTDANTVGMRSADMDAFDFYRLPNNAHFPNVYPIGGSCGSNEIGMVSQLQNGEEKFFIGKAKYSDFLFFVIKGRKMEIYNLPVCVEKVGVEATFNSPEIDISLDVAFEIATTVFGILINERQMPISGAVDNSYDSNELKELIRQRNANAQS